MSVVANRAFAGVSTLASAMVMAIALWLLVALVIQGAPELSFRFLIAAPERSGLAGGIGSVLVSTLLILGVCLAVVIPLGLGCALFLTEVVLPENPLARAVGYCLDVLSGVPSIVYALFGYQLFAISLGLGFSILSGGLTLACMALPLMVRVSQQALLGVPHNLVEAGHALSLSRAGMLARVVLPEARHGIAAATVLSTGRALAETAVLLFTAGYVLRMPGSLLDSGRALSVHIYDMAMHVPGGQGRAAASALVLVALIVLINLAVHRLLNTGKEE